MNLRAAFLAQEALQNADGTFMVWRGGITEFQVTALPVMITASLVLRIEADAQEARRLHHIRFRVVHAGQEPPWHEVPAAFKEPPQPQVPSYLNLLVNFHVGVTQPGEGHIDVVVDQELISPHLPFTVTLIPLPPGFRLPSP